MNKLGMHIHGLQPGILEAVALLQPRTVTIMDPKPEDIQAIRDVSPGTFVVARKYEDGRAWQETDPYVWAEMNYDMCGGLPTALLDGMSHSATMTGVHASPSMSGPTSLRRRVASWEIWKPSFCAWLPATGLGQTTATKSLTTFP